MSDASDDESEAESNDFLDSMQGVKRLQHDRVDLHEQKPRAKPLLQTDRSIDLSDSRYDEHAISRHSEHSVQDSWFNHGLNKSIRRKIKMGQLELEARVDLHGYRRHEALRELGLFMQSALSQNLRVLLIIHGVGYRSYSESILRPLVQRWLSEQPEVLAYCPAQPSDGGAGATYVYLKK